MDTLELPVVETAAGTATDGGRNDRDDHVTAVLPVTPSVASAGRPSRSGIRPFDRPPIELRLFAALLGMGAVLGAAALLLSDRAPGAMRSVFGERARRLWERIDASERVDLPPGSELPPADFFVHVGIWAVVATLVGFAVWSWRGLFVSAVVLAVSSALIELAQGRYADTRTVEGRDAVANLVGVGAGIAVSAACYLIWSGLATLARRLRRS